MTDFKTYAKDWTAKAFNLSTLRTGRMPWVDYLRGIAIILVVYRHGLIGISRSGIAIPEYLVEANMIFYSFRMPLFFIISGIFITKSLANKKLNQVIFEKFSYLLYPYFIWAFIQITLQIILIKYVNSDRSLLDYTYIFYQPRILDQFWYLPALFNTTVFYVLIKVKLKPPAWVQLMLGLLFYFSSPYFIDISMISDWMEYYIYFALGDAIARYFFTEPVQRFLKNPLSLLFILPVFAAVQLFYLSQDEYYYRLNVLGEIEYLVIALIGCLSMFILAFRLQSLKILSFLRIVGYHSLYIYVMHVLAIACMRILLTNLLHINNPFILLILGITFGVIIPILFYNLVIRLRRGYLLFSLHKPKVVAEKKGGTDQVPKQRTTES